MPLKNYPSTEKIHKLLEQIEMTRSIQHEYGAPGIDAVLSGLEGHLSSSLAALQALKPDAALKAREPDDLPGIRALRPEGPRTLVKGIPADYRERLEGAMLGRIAGCLLGSIVEGWKVPDMEKWAIEIGDGFPPRDYWSQAKTPLGTRYIVAKNQDYTRGGMAGVPPDDDIIYIIAALMILEKYGFDFKPANTADYWDEFLPWIWIDMEYAKDKYKKEGVPAEHAADDSPYSQLICPFIRIDGYAWAVPGRPEKAAELAWRDSTMSHRRSGLYGGMLFAAAEAAAFAVDDPVEAVRIGLKEIPRDCDLARYVGDALAASDIRNYRDARAWVDERFAGMHTAHTINNACLVVFGLMIGGTDFTKVISETVAMGMDNDCTAATAGSIAGAVVGAKGIPAHWTKNFCNRIHTYIKGNEYVWIDDLLTRYEKVARIGADTK